MKCGFLFGMAASGMALTATGARAQTSEVPPAEDLGGDTLTIGVGGVVLPDYEGSDDYRIVPAPAAIGSYKGFSFLLAGNRLSVDVIPNRTGDTIDIQAGPIGVVNFNRANIDAIDDPQVRLLPERDTAIELGGYVGIGKSGIITSPYDKLSVSVSYRYDVAGVHKSGVLAPTINYLTPLSRKAAVALFLSAERAERGYARAYFDVTPADSAASGLPVYYARGGWKNYTIGAVGTYALTGDLLHGWKVVAGGTYRRLVNDYGDSPLTSIAGSRAQWLGGVGIGYTF